jgi:type IV pilus assembly protein PilY1
MTPTFRRLPRSAWIWGALLLALAALGLSFAAGSQSGAPAFKSINLASDPLYATTTGDKPAMALALSVEYPTVGAQYVPGGETDNTYTTAREYLGYYDANGCYAYNQSPSETPAAGQTASDYRRFDRIGTTTTRSCADAFSGNFLNWASSSAIDMLRLALSGGDRYIDTAGLTILQRAVIPNGDPVCMWNTTNFPAKQLSRNGGAAGAYWGAVPVSMRNDAASNDIWVANTLNRIYFGTSRTGNCNNTGAYTLGGATPTQVGPVTSASALPGGSGACAGEGGTCTTAGGAELWYGANSSWRVAPVNPAGASVACSNDVFGDPISGVSKQCFIRPPNASRPWPSTATTTRLNPDGFFYARVQVCGRNASGDLEDNRDYTNPFCTRYPNGNFKPTGVVQKYSDQLRLAALGYLLDQTSSGSGGRYGGVLRAPMKYVGARTFDVFGQDSTPLSGNPNAEWNVDTGVFRTNPDNNATWGVSGVINYLNKFGRTGPVAGRYKIYDPVSELYYESLRYMQGLPPSTDAIKGLNTTNPTTDAKYDGFPVFTDWSAIDPYAGRSATGDYSCLKSNIVVVGDVNTHDDKTKFPKGKPSANIPDVDYWTRVVQDFESNTPSTYTDGQGVVRQTGNPSKAKKNNNPRGDAIVGYAYWAHTQDIRGRTWTEQPDRQRPGLRVKTFIFDVNEYGAQNNTDTRRLSNQFFTAAKYGGFDASAADAPVYNPFGDPFVRPDGTPDDDIWQDPTAPGEAKTYYLQSNARGVLDAFEKIFSRATTRASSIAGSALSGSRTAQGNTVYQGQFDTSDWSGDVEALPINVDAAGNAAVSTTATWSASAQLAARVSAGDARNIVIGSAGSTAVATAVPFTWDAISPTLKQQLDQATPATTTDGLGQERLNYLRGAATRESNPFRRRNNKLLGDIVNSGVAYSGVPSANITSNTYAGFRADQLTRTPAVFVGANDGMLHAFNATNGRELFGYIPSWMGPKLAALTNPTYVAEHQSYVDATPVVAEAEVGTLGTKADWRTVLVSGTGAGGRGVFALDVTDPTAFAASKVMWEFTQADDRDMGFVVGRPQILRMRTSAAGVAATYKTFAVVASGVNNYVSQNGVFSPTGAPALFLLDLAKPASTAWSLGSNYFKISFPVNATLAATTAPGVVNFEAVAGAQREVTLIYAGDLHGNLWKLDFRPWGTANWTMAKLSAFVSGGATPLPMFTARDAANNVQPITMTPTIVAGLRSNSSYVAFGTGKYLEVDDRASLARQSFYAIHDNGTNTPDAAANATAAISGRGRLAVGTLNAATGGLDVPAFVPGRAASDGDATQRSGWYFDYPGSGERQVSIAQVTGNSLVFASLIPGTSANAGVCGVTGGSGRDYVINVDTGDGRTFISKVGILTAPIVLDLANTEETQSIGTGRRTRTVTSQIVSQGSSGFSQTTTQKRTIIVGRLSWRQINNYQDLRNAAP